MEILHVHAAAQPGTALALLSRQALPDLPCKGGEREWVRRMQNMSKNGKNIRCGCAHCSVPQCLVPPAGQALLHWACVQALAECS